MNPLPKGPAGLHSGLMAETVVDEKAIAKNDQWRERIAAQKRSGLSVRRFCKEQGIAEHPLFDWRKRLRNQQQPLRFALVRSSRRSSSQLFSGEVRQCGINQLAGSLAYSRRASRTTGKFESASFQSPKKRS